MTINERVRYLRKEIKHESQADMARTLGMTQTGVSYMERTPSAVTEQNIKSICLLYNVREDWLRYGQEPIFGENDTFSLDAYAAERGATPLDIEIVKAYFELESSVRNQVLHHFIKRLSNTDEKKDLFPGYRSSSDLEEEYAPEESDNSNSSVS